MNRPGYNPTRRNRNIGTEKAGWGQDNRLVIPAAWADDRRYYEKLVNPVRVPIKVRSVSLHIIVEPPLSGFAHACTVEDIVHLLQLIPVAHFQAFRLIVLRQPKRKERILSPAWGRWVYWSNIGDLSGSAIYLEAQRVGVAFQWSKSLAPDSARELDRLREDGHTIAADKRHHLISSTLDSVRRTQLYRTLPHEIGHYVDYLHSVEDPSRDNIDQWIRLDEVYRARPSQEKEAFAHRYADEFRHHMTIDARLPFDRIVDERSMKQQGLSPEWFAPPDRLAAPF
jgi:hypothetical protein